MKHLFCLLLCIPFLLLTACGGGEEKKTYNKAPTFEGEENKTASNGNPDYDPNRGEGKFTKVDLGDKLDATLADAGEKVQSVKCASCHKLTDERLVGPGWKGVTERRKPEWLMNFITNPAPMIDKDPELQKQLEICMVRMPNQNLADDEARKILEFMRKNDGVK